jgi:hypothetical protein
MWKSIAALLLLATPALAQDNPTAYEALRAVSAQFGRNSLNHIISVTGVNGTPQPQRWKILLEDPGGRGGVREVEVENGEVASDHPARIVGTPEGGTIKTARLNLDSSGAYAVASHTADKSNARFATVSYTLRTDERGNPVWIITLQNRSARPVGTIHIAANRGEVMRTEGLFAGATMEDVETEQDVEQNRDEGGIIGNAKARVRETFRRAQDEARGMFDRVRRSFTDFINRV